MLKRSVHPEKKDKYIGKTEKDTFCESLSADELHQIDLEMNCGYGMFIPGCFSYGIWYFH